MVNIFFNQFFAAFFLFIKMTKLLKYKIIELPEINKNMFLLNES